MTKAVALCVAIMLLGAPFLAAADDGNPVRKDPILAGALSYYVPGLGQLYAGSYLKGAAFWVLEQTLLVSTLLTVADIDISVSGDVSLGIDIKAKDETSRQERKTAIVLGTGLLLVHFLNILDAVNTTRNYNLQRAGGMYAEFNYDQQEQACNLQLNTRF